MDRAERAALRAKAEHLLDCAELAEVKEWSDEVYGPNAVEVGFLFARFEDGDPGMYVVRSRAFDADGNELPMLEDDGTFEGDYPSIRSDGYYAGYMYDWQDWRLAATFKIREPKQEVNHE